jgi:hypothetical protein
MLYALKNIGEYFSEYNPEKLEQKFREEFLTDPFEGNVVLCIIDLDKSNESKHEFKSYKYSEIRNKILYKKSSGANACNYTLTFETSLKNLSDKNKLEKDINRLILRWIKNYESKINNKDAKEMLIYIKEKVYKIFEDLKEYAKDFKPKERFLFSFAYKKDGKEYYTCDYFNLEELEKEIKNKFKGKNKDAKGKCILCGQKNIELYGHVLQEIGLQFFTVNQKGFAPGIDEKSAYKKIPICWECAKKIALGKIWIDKYCKYKFRGNIYYYIRSPSLTIYPWTIVLMPLILYWFHKLSYIFYSTLLYRHLYQVSLLPLDNTFYYGDSEHHNHLTLVSLWFYLMLYYFVCSPREPENR